MIEPITISIIGYLAQSLFRAYKNTENANKTIIEAQIMEDSEKIFHEKIQAQSALVLLNEEATNLTVQLDETVKKVIQTNDDKLIEEVLSFSKKNKPLLLASTPEKPVSNEKIAEIKSELGLVELKVLWFIAQKEAKLKAERDQELQKQTEFINRKGNEKKLQQRMFIYFSVYALLILLISFVGYFLLPTTTIIPVLGIPLSVIVWGSLGSLASMLYRFYKRSEVQDIEQELRWLFARPLLGILMGAIVYLLVVSGAVLIGITNAQPIDLKMEFLWLFAFVGGFSDKVFESAVEKVGLFTKPDDKTKQDMQKLIELMSANHSSLSSEFDPSNYKTR